jgi:hypothetical protein|tara:strand:+ start:831 stop:980 length:150 start_codon:yes stop_codon:yes gene_type:complete
MLSSADDQAQDTQVDEANASSARACARDAMLAEKANATARKPTRRRGMV